MKRLVTQFDDGRSRATVATPTCCCCCCCCVASTLTTSTVTAVTAYKGARHSGRGRLAAWLLAVAGFLVFPVAIIGGLLIATALDLALGAIVVVLLALVGLALLVYTYAGVANAALMTLIPLGIVMVGFSLEVSIAGTLLFANGDDGGGGVVAYLVVAVAIPVAVGWAMLRWRPRS